MDVLYGESEDMSQLRELVVEELSFLIDKLSVNKHDNATHGEIPKETHPVATPKERIK